MDKSFDRALHYYGSRLWAGLIFLKLHQVAFVFYVNSFMSCRRVTKHNILYKSRVEENLYVDNDQKCVFKTRMLKHGLNCKSWVVITLDCGFHDKRC